MLVYLIARLNLEVQLGVIALTLLFKLRKACILLGLSFFNQIND